MRKAAHQAVFKLVKNAPKAVVASEVASFCIRGLETHGGMTPMICLVTMLKLGIAANLRSEIVVEINIVLASTLDALRGSCCFGRDGCLPV